MNLIPIGTIAIFLLFSPALNAQMTVEEMEQIDEGLRLFNEETFDGNGRTCSTCHIAEQSYNIFPHNIRSLNTKDRDLVFAINVPGLENIELIKSHALFNVSGNADVCAADTPECWGAEGEEHSGPAFRGSMGLQALSITTKPSVDYPGTPLLPMDCSTGVIDQLPQLGWAGDGSPGTPKTVDDPDTPDVDESIDCQVHHGFFDFDAVGDFRAFAPGAIAQHLTLSLSRTPGVDFRFATADELDAMEDFQLWLGRRPLTPEENAIQGTIDATEFDLTLLDFKDERVALGRDHFVGEAEFVSIGRDPPVANNPDSGAGCNKCHVNGGAISETAGGGDGSNVQTATEVELSSVGIGLDVVGFPLPHDAGGSDSIGRNPENEFDDVFNLQSIIESAEKFAWFHNHKVLDDFEQAIAHYTTDDFVDNVRDFTTLDAMQNGNLSGSISFPNGDGIDHLGAFLRALDAFYGLRDCERLIDEAIDRIGEGVSLQNPIDHCMFNLDDSRRVLKESKLPKLYKNVDMQLNQIKGKLKHAAKKKDIAKLEDSRSKIRAARDDIAEQISP